MNKLEELSKNNLPPLEVEKMIEENMAKETVIDA